MTSDASYLYFFIEGEWRATIARAHPQIVWSVFVGWWWWICRVLFEPLASVLLPLGNPLLYLFKVNRLVVRRRLLTLPDRDIHRSNHCVDPTALVTSLTVWSRPAFSWSDLGCIKLTQGLLTSSRQFLKSLISWELCWMETLLFSGLIRTCRHPQASNQ
jgi:hypothetical protein